MVDTPQIKRILFITLSNLGDAMMALPAFDSLKREYPRGRITVVVGPRTKCVFENHPDVDDLIIFKKNAPLRHKIDLFYQLKKKNFDLIVDLKNTFYRWGLRAPYKNPSFVAYPSWVQHFSRRHLYTALRAFRGADIGQEEFLAFYEKRNPSFISDTDKEYIHQLLGSYGVLPKDRVVVVVPGARSDLKQWDPEGFLEVVRQLRDEFGFKVVLSGLADEASLTSKIAHSIGEGVIDVAGKTNFGQLCALILSAELIVCNDSGVLHIASYLNRPIVALFGPTDCVKYGPWSNNSMAVRKSVSCAPCGKSSCCHQLECLKMITPFDVILALRLVLEGRGKGLESDLYKRILVVRTDRIGDVLISTPVLKALRHFYPMSHIAMMVSPYTREIVDGNPFIDEVIVLDKDGRHQGLLGTLKAVSVLKRKKFDLAIILHPTIRIHLICFLADIKERIGYSHKASYFLTKALPHYKQQGLKHESEYNFDLLRPLGITGQQQELYMPIKQSSEEFVDNLLHQAGIALSDRLIAVNPAASCISKRWPVARFADMVDRLTVSYHAKIVIVADAAHQDISGQLMRITQCKPIDLSGKLSLSQLASLFKRCALVISNDSGPVHLAVAVGTSVISIFGRNQPGLGPLRWGPLGDSSVVIHKKTDCLSCLAHACENQFKCLEAISVEEVLEHAKRLLREADKKYKDSSFFKKN
ncbi:MAG: lipopolysaccharide heptosyltransferase II [Candidatus Omnitrophota bacterium]